MAKEAKVYLCDGTFWAIGFEDGADPVVIATRPEWANWHEMEASARNFGFDLDTTRAYCPAPEDVMPAILDFEEMAQ